MARQTQAEWEAYYTGLFLTGVPGNITAAKMRSFCAQLLDNNKPVFAVFNSNQQHSITLTTVPAKFLIFDEAATVPADNTEIDPDLANNVFNYPLGWIYKTSMSLVIDGTNGIEVFGQFYRDNGTGFEPEGDIAAATLRGTNNPVGLTIPAFPFLMNDASTIELRLWTGTGSPVIRILNTDKTSWMITELVPWAI